jgi:lipoate-protein ligase A
MKPTSGTLSADYKVEGGKLLRVRMTTTGEDEGPKGQPPTIKSITLTGDFFMHPEDAVEELEARLTGAPLEREALRARVQAFYESGVQVIGAGVDDIVHVILSAA